MQMLVILLYLHGLTSNLSNICYSVVMTKNPNFIILFLEFGN